MRSGLLRILRSLVGGLETVGKIGSHVFFKVETAGRKGNLDPFRG